MPAAWRRAAPTSLKGSPIEGSEGPTATGALLKAARKQQDWRQAGMVPRASSGIFLKALTHSHADAREHTHTPSQSSALHMDPHGTQALHPQAVGHQDTHPSTCEPFGTGCAEGRGDSGAAAVGTVNIWCGPNWTVTGCPLPLSSLLPLGGLTSFLQCRMTDMRLGLSLWGLSAAPSELRLGAPNSTSSFRLLLPAVLGSVHGMSM